MTNSALSLAVEQGSVFASVAPAQKLRLVEAMQAILTLLVNRLEPTCNGQKPIRKPKFWEAQRYSVAPPRIWVFE